jgi:hypothetical protein
LSTVSLILKIHSIDLNMVVTEEQWEAIIACVAKNPGTSAWELFPIRNLTGLVQQCDVDRDLLRELGMRESPQYAFCCDVIHNLEKYK